MTSCLGFVLKQLDSPHEELLSTAVHSLEIELRKLGEIPWLYYILQLNDDEVSEICTCKLAFDV